MSPPAKKQSRREPERRADGEAGASPAEHDGYDEQRAEPEGDGRGCGGWSTWCVSTIDRERRTSPANASDDSEPFVNVANRCGLPVDTDHGQHGDPGRADRLNEREQARAQGGHVDQPANGLGGERLHPAPIGEEQAHESAPAGAARSPALLPRHRARASTPS